MADKKKPELDAKKQESDLKLQIMKSQLQSMEQQHAEIDMKKKQLEQMKDIISGFKAEKNAKSLSEIGLGIYAETEMKNVDKLLVNIGSNLLVRRTPKEIAKMLNNQIKILDDIQLEIFAEIEKISTEAHAVQHDLGQCSTH